jgi:uncharacterized membrane protein
MNKLIKGIVIVAGTIVTVLLMKFLRLPFPYLSGWTIAYAVIATLALNFGAGAGGAVGLLGRLIVSISYGFNAWAIPYILLAGLYGFIIGKISDNKSLKPDGNNSIGNLGIFSLSAAAVNIGTGIAGIIITVIIGRGSVPAGFLIRSTIIDGIIVGVIAFVLAFTWYKCSTITSPSQSALSAKRRAKRLAAISERQEGLMLFLKTKPFEKRLECINNFEYLDLSAIEKEINKAAKAYTACKNKYNREKPEAVLERYKSTEKEGMGFKGGLRAFFGEGKDVINEVKERYKGLIDIHGYFEAALDMSLARAEKFDVKYRVAREKAILYGEQIIKITEKIPLKDREAFSKMGSLQTSALQFSWQDAAKKLSLAEKNYFQAGKQVSKNFDKWTNGYSKRLGRQGTITKWDAFEAGLVLLGKGIDNVTRASEQVKIIGEEKLKTYEAINVLSESRIDADAFIDRIKELDRSLLKSMDAWEKVFSDVYNELFPAGDVSKTHEQREKREAEDGTYFSDQEIQKLMELAQVLKYMMEIVDAEV